MVSKKTPLLIVLPAFIIIISLFLQNTPSSSSRSLITPSPTPETKFTPQDIAAVKEFEQIMSKCGDFPPINSYVSDKLLSPSPKQWSPDCNYIAWSNTSSPPWDNSPPDKFKADPLEGLFIYNSKTQKTSRIYIPTQIEDVVFFQSWLDSDNLTFTKNIDSKNYNYNISTKKISNL